MSPNPFQFEILKQSSKSQARVGRLTTPHGIIDTPNYVAVGTNGTLKAVDNELVDTAGLQLMFCNTYHLLLQPGVDTIRQAGGLHNFINRKGPIITDSGGFQVFSLAYGGVASELKSKGQRKTDGMVLRIDEEGVLFRSYRDGRKLLLTPETSIQAQKDLGADIIIPFDELPPYHIEKDKLEESLDRTHRWEKRSLKAHVNDPRGQAMYAVVHGGVYEVLRKKSCQYLAQLPFDGYAIGGSFGKTKKHMMDMLSYTLPYLPKEAPNHLLGIADLPSVNQIIPLGIDTFDSSYPMRAARHGLLLTEEGGMKIGKTENKSRFEAIEKGCDCPTCKRFSVAYLHHLFKAKEVVSMTLASLHNLHFMIRLMSNIRKKIWDDEI